MKTTERSSDEQSTASHTALACWDRPHSTERRREEERGERKREEGRGGERRREEASGDVCLGWRDRAEDVQRRGWRG